MTKIIQGLWVGRPLSAIERLSIVSFLRHGHEYHLYCYEDVGNVPAGTVVEDARAILPASEIFCYAQGAERGSVSAFSNLFRYKLLLDRGGWWADTDAVCLRPWDFADPVVLASEHTRGAKAKLANGVMKLPQGHPVAAACYEMAVQADRQNLRWGQIGSELLTLEVVRGNLLHRVMKPVVFCPIPWWDWTALLADDPRPALSMVTDQSYSVHLWHEMWRREQCDPAQEFPPTSLFAQLLERYAVEQRE